MTSALRIVVADDEPDVCDYYRKILPRLGHTVVATAKTGEELIAQCLTHRPDLIITDIKMPDLDGIDAAVKLRQEMSVPIILVSAFSDARLIERTEAGHIMAYLVKPIKQTDLEPVIALAVRRFHQFKTLRHEAEGLQERERLMQFQLATAGRIQRHLLPAQPPELPSYDLALAYHPLDSISGDYYDFLMLPSGRLGILIADACGHGVPAAFVSVMANTLFHAHAQGAESPAAVLQTINHQLANLRDTGRFLTMFYGVLERQAGRLEYALAGHPPPLWYRRASRTVEVFEGEGLPIGILPDVPYQGHSVQLAPGDVVLLYTDGVTECRNEQGEQFGRHRLQALLSEQGDAAAEVVTALDAELTHFRGVEPFHDDVTCIGLSVQDVQLGHPKRG
jgi:serine phosphatase RsbU (regulator of sigma subunit)